MPNNCTTKHVTDVPQIFAYINNIVEILDCVGFIFL